VPWVHAGYDRDEARAWIEEQQRAWEQGEAYSFAIVEADTDCFLGGIGINRIDERDRSANWDTGSGRALRERV